MELFGNLNVNGGNCIVHLDPMPSEDSPYGGWISNGKLMDTVSRGQSLYYHFTEEAYGLACANSYATMPCRAIALEDIYADQSGLILLYGMMYHKYWNFKSSQLYISATIPGQLTHIRPNQKYNIIQLVGYAKLNNAASFDFNSTMVELI